MSGGSMEHRHEQLRAILADHADLFKLEDSDFCQSALRKSFKAHLRSLNQQLQITADMLKAVEKEDSGDTTPEATQEAFDKFQAEAAKLEWL